MAAIREVFSANDPLDQEQAFIEVARALGFRRTGNRIRQVVKSALRTAIRRHIVYRDKDVYALECRHIEHYSRDELIDALLAAMGTTWWDRADAIRVATRRLGFRRTGSRITKAFKSAINGAIRRNLLESNGDLVRKKKS